MSAWRQSTRCSPSQDVSLEGPSEPSSPEAPGLAQGHLALSRGLGRPWPPAAHDNLQAALTSCSGCALHEAAVQRPQGGHHGPSASPAPLSAAVLFASLLVLVEEKETGVLVSSTLGFEYFSPTCVPFKSHGDAPASCFRRSSLWCRGHTATDGTTELHPHLLGAPVPTRIWACEHPPQS